MNKSTLIVLSTVTAVLFGCGKHLDLGAGSNLPLVTPVVKSAAPSGLKGSSTASILNFLYSNAQASGSSLSVSDFHSRFFTSGPTAILTNLLPSLDLLISTINEQTANQESPCLKQSPISYVIQPAGQDVTMYAQCYMQGSGSYTGDPGFVQFGVNDGVTYIYSAVGAEWEAAIITPIEGSPGEYSAKAYVGLGYSNTFGCSSSWDGCSYGLMQISANSAAHTFELAVAGMGFGFCGAQLVSDGTNIYAEGSVDMGTSCLSVGSICVSASDGSTSATCSADQQAFSLPAIGRSSVTSSASLVVGSWGASAYPASGANVEFDGSANDAIHFGPLTPTSGTSSL